MSLATIEGFSSTVKTQFLSLFDFGNPFTIYFWVLMFGLGVRFILVLRPLNRVYKKYRIPGKLKIWKIPIPFTDPGKDWKKSAQRAKDTIRKAKEVKEQTKITGIEKFLVLETVLAIAPSISAGVLRIVLGSPTITQWTNNQMYVLFCVFIIWLASNIRRSFEMRKSLKVLDRWYTDPRILNRSLSMVTITRKGLGRLSKLEIPEYREEIDWVRKEVTAKNEKGKMTFDRGAIIHNAKSRASEIVTKAVNLAIATKSATQSLGEKGKKEIDSKLQQKVEETLNLEAGRFWPFVRSMLVVFGPLVVLYSLPYSLEHIFDTLFWW
ncbi:hypothetical protein N9V20_00495 [Candidatus Poseidoniales archaeon]|jgi:hypothetical protein|nr:hypothetical protein [Candidatus Poseidoniales archaeon]